MATPATTLYRNTTDHRIELGIGTRPGSAWTRYDSDPGQFVTGPSAPAYKEKFLRAGYAEATADDVELARMEEEEAKAQAAAAKAVALATAKAEGEAMAAEAEAKAKAEAEASQQDVPAAASKPQKGSRANRGPTG